GRMADRSRRYHPGAVKLMLDGVCENFTARSLTPYLDAAGHPTANFGMDYIDPEALPGFVTAVMARGMQPHFHALGDAAVRSALDAVAAARAVLGWSDTRPHLAHLQIVHPDDVGRFRTLGVAANAQALWACADAAMTELTMPFLGEPRSSWQYPFGDLVRAGAVLAMGSDWSVTSADPLPQIAVAVTRRVPGDPGSEPFLPGQAITIGDALTAFTAGSAWVNHREAASGTLAVGYDADLVILDGDPFAVDDVGSLRVSETIVRGETVYKR
ncbi:MAG TPA: amidohydrolase family protein, partial [Acidimicrobiia bacterium]|nr:amidohydrolase family protein [Acidimicrobiia bacterium]